MAVDPRFEYQDISQAGITSKQVKEWAAFVMSSNGVTGIPLMVWTGVKIALVTMLVGLLERLEAREARIKKQKYEGAQDDKNQESIDKDDLGGSRRE